MDETIRDSIVSAILANKDDMGKNELCHYIEQTLIFGPDAQNVHINIRDIAEIYDTVMQGEAGDDDEDYDDEEEE